MTENEVRAIAAEEADRAIASLAGLVLKRLQLDRLSRDPARNTAEDVLDERLSEIFGEVLAQRGDI